jgi:hypothetical protein
MIIRTINKYDTYTTEFNNSDVSLEQLFTAFKSHLIALSWTEEQINNYILELSEEIKK